MKFTLKFIQYISRVIQRDTWEHAGLLFSSSRPQSFCGTRQYQGLLSSLIRVPCFCDTRQCQELLPSCYTHTVSVTSGSARNFCLAVTCTLFLWHPAVPGTSAWLLHAHCFCDIWQCQELLPSCYTHIVSVTSGSARNFCLAVTRTLFLWHPAVPGTSA